MCRLTLIAFMVILLSSCSEKSPKVSTLVEELTGADKIKQYHATKTKIEGINNAARERVEEVE
ncbi:MAG: hypothetical protein V1882_08465 [Candidatus Omnitrophota bacterium]